MQTKMICISYTPWINILILSVSFANCANILGVFFHGGKSHHILGEVLFKELARRGHNVTMISPFPLKEPVANYTDIYLEGVLEDQNSREPMYLKMNKDLSASLGVFGMTFTQSELTFKSENVRDLINSGTKFDLVIIDWFLSYSLLIYGEVFNAPVILISSSGSIMASEITGNPTPPSFIPFMLPFPNNMTFLQRSVNSLANVALNVIEYVDIRLHYYMLQKYFPKAPSYDKLQNRVALVLSNSHYSFESPRPYVPNIIPIGGFHIEKTKTLPEDLKRLMDQAEHGVIYFSLGSVMKSKNLPKDIQQHIINAFSKIKQTVLWKWEDETVPNLPKNVIVKKWLPQNVLAHPNVKIFISHGGLLSTIEAIYFAKPVIGIPIFGDQQANVYRAVEFGYAVEINLKDLTEETLLAAIKEIMDNPRYAENIRERSSLLKDQSISPMETAVFWVEHVIKHRGAPHLKNTGIYLRWYQYLLLDVTLFLIVVISFGLVMTYFCVRKMFQLLKYLLLRKIKKE